jgi:hypothetical protein
MLCRALMDMHRAKFRASIECWYGFTGIEQSGRIKRRLHCVKNRQLEGCELRAHLVDFL